MSVKHWYCFSKALMVPMTFMSMQWETQSGTVPLAMLTYDHKGTAILRLSTEGALKPLTKASDAEIQTLIQELTDEANDFEQESTEVALDMLFHELAGRK